jgi:hypothetical protein
MHVYGECRCQNHKGFELQPEIRCQPVRSYGVEARSRVTGSQPEVVPQVVKDIMARRVGHFEPITYGFGFQIISAKYVLAKDLETVLYQDISYTEYQYILYTCLVLES